MKKLVYSITTLLFFFFVLFPLLLMIAGSFFDHSGFTLRPYLLIFNKNTFLLLFRSALLASAVAFLSTALGAFFAFSLTKTDLPARGALKLTILIPLFISPYILAVSWVGFFILFQNGARFIYSPAGVIFVLSLILAPLSMIIISSGLVNISARLEEATLMMSDYKTTLIKIILPLLKPALVSSFVLSFVLALSEFSVPAFLSVNVLTTEIFTQFSAFYNYDAAVANSMLLIVICITLLMAERFYLAEAPFFSVSVKSHKTKLIKLHKAKYPLLFFHLLYLMFAVFTPVAMLAAQAFRDGGRMFAKAFAILSAVMVNSLLYAAAGAFFLLLFGLVFAYMSERDGHKTVNLVLLLTFGIPSTVLGIGLIKFFNTSYFHFIYSGFWIIIIGYLGRFIFISEKIISNAIKQIPPSFEEAAQLSGAGFVLRIRKILLPLIAEGLVAAFLLGFIFSLSELGTTILVYPPGTSVMPITVYTIMANAPQSLTSALSLIVLFITFAALLVLFAGHRFLIRNKRRAY